MSLRMNLYGWNRSSFTNILGSKDSVVLDAASSFLSEILQEEPAISKAKAWLRILIESGFPLRQVREPPSEPTDGGLLTMQMETEVHVFAVHSIARSIARGNYLDLVGDSSHWGHAAVRSLYDELQSCGFTRSKSSPAQLHSWMLTMSNGSPLFGDDFRTEWSFYSLFDNEELAAMIPVLQSALDFNRPVPEDYSDELAKTIVTSLSKQCKEFVSALIEWFGRIQRAGQDAFILWW